MMHKYFAASRLVTILATTCASIASAQTVTNDDFTQTNDTNAWQAFGGACLTAGDGSGSIPACVGPLATAYYRGQIQVGGNSGFLGQATTPSSGVTEAPDPAGKGALRFTNGAPYGFGQAGSIISIGTPFATSAGLQVVFKTVTYEGDSGGSGKDGADGMAFFLMDGAYAPYDTGAFGGSLGYTCSNSNNDSTLRTDGTPRGYDGLAHGYLGLGIDEYGNFLNQGDNTSTGFGYVPGRIGLRGAGNVTWASLNSLNSIYYPSSLTAAQRTNAVQNTCSTGFLWDYSKVNSRGATITGTAIADYAPIYSAPGVGAYSILTGFNIANEAATKRSDATPITYNLKITQNGLLSMSYSLNGGNYVPVITRQNITSSNGALPDSFRFGFTGSTGGSTNVHEILCFQAAPADLAATSVGINEKEATKIESGTQAYLAYYYPGTWTGRLTASDLLYNAYTQSLIISSTANWDASCNLTGIEAGTAHACESTGKVGPVPAQTPASRTMLTWNGSNGVAFEWSSGNSITSAQQNNLDLGDIPLPYTADRLNYLRGDRSNEFTSLGVGKYRSREALLGDIVNSSPTWVGPPTSPYAAIWADLLVADPLPENSGSQSYTQYLATAQTRLNVVYTGSNDGFLHGFRSGAFDSSGNYVNNSTFPNDGLEVLAYMPGAVLKVIHNSVDPSLDLSNASYGHNFYIDATPAVDELFYKGVWHSWLVGGLGAGGAAIYALDVTDPSQFSEGNAKKLVVGEWAASTISCLIVTGCGANMGNTYGVPVIRRLHNGKWAIIFGNGFGSSTGDAGIYIMTVNPTDGTIASTYYLGTGTSGSNNGIAYVAPADLDGDHITDYIYAGDLHGNVWRFDLTSNTESSWAASASPLFTVASGQPVTTKLIVAKTNPTSGMPRVLIDFGTGRKIPQSNIAPASYASGAQKLYGIWDWNMAAWNSKSSVKMASLSSPQTVNESTLQTQTLTLNVSGNLDITGNPVCWAGSTTCAGGAPSNSQFGFDVALLGTNEQVIFTPLLYQNALLVNTTIPANNSPTDCKVTHDTGNTIGIAADTGGAIPGFFVNVSTDASVAGSQTNATGTPFVVLAGGNSFVLTQSLGDGQVSGGVLSCPAGNLFCDGHLHPNQPGTNNGKRVTWVERR